MKFETKSINTLPTKPKLTGAANLPGLIGLKEDAKNQVELALKQEPDYARVFTYLFRRFGAPVCPCDDYKSLCQYYLTTPMENVYLSVYPASSGYSFGYVYPKEMFNKMAWGYVPAQITWYKKMQKWAKENHGVNLFGGFGSLLSICDKPSKQGPVMGKRNKALFYKEINNWLHTAYPQYAGEDVSVPDDERDRIILEFIKSKEAEIDVYVKVFKKIERKPSNKNKEGLALARKIQSAIKATAKDLLRPVRIRDVYFNVLGNVADKDIKSEVEYFDYNPQAQVLRKSFNAA